MTTGLLDTSVVIDWHDPVVVATLPEQMATAATAHANGLDLYRRNGDDFEGLAELVHVVAL